ncbi:elongator complex protein 3 [Thermincola ferriacetica]
MILETRYFIIPIFIPDLGCPNQCVFCNQQKITGQVNIPTAEEVARKIGDYLATLPDVENRKVEVAFYGGSFTAIPVEEQKRFLRAAWDYYRTGKIQGIRISTRPDKIDEDTLSILMAYGVDTIELGVQSMDKDVLAFARRGHATEHVVKAAKLVKSWGFFLGVQIMIGLPGDSQEKALKTCNEVIGLGPDFVRIYPVLVLKGTELERLFYQGKYFPWQVNEVVDTAKKMLNRFERAGIEVIRIGLQNTEEISPGGEIIAGPYHPAIGELVYGALIYEQLRELLNRTGAVPGGIKEVEFAVSPRDESKVRGHKSANIKALQEHYGLKTVKIIPDPELVPGTIKLTRLDEEEKGVVLRRKDLIL